MYITNIPQHDDRIYLEHAVRIAQGGVRVRYVTQAEGDSVEVERVVVERQTKHRGGGSGGGSGGGGGGGGGVGCGTSRHLLPATRRPRVSRC